MSAMEEKVKQLTEQGRAFVSRWEITDPDLEGYETDQELKRPQPPLAKAPMTDNSIELPKDFSGLRSDRDFLDIVNARESHRVYTGEPMTLTELSYLLWCTQGVKEIRGRSYATLRTVPCGGARHEFECYSLPETWRVWSRVCIITCRCTTGSSFSDVPMIWTGSSVCLSAGRPGRQLPM